MKRFWPDLVGRRTACGDARRILGGFSRQVHPGALNPAARNAGNLHVHPGARCVHKLKLIFSVSQKEDLCSRQRLCQHRSLRSSYAHEIVGVRLITDDLFQVSSLLGQLLDAPVICSGGLVRCLRVSRRCSRCISRRRKNGSLVGRRAGSCGKRTRLRGACRYGVHRSMLRALVQHLLQTVEQICFQAAIGREYSITRA